MSASASVMSRSSVLQGSQSRGGPEPDASSATGASASFSPPHWGVCLHSSVFRVEVTGRDVLYSLHRNGTLRYYYHLLQATATSTMGQGDLRATAATSLRDSFTEDAKARASSSSATPPPPVPDPALTQRVVQRCLRLSIPQIVSFRYTIHKAHHVAASTNVCASGTNPNAASTSTDVGASSPTSGRRALSTDQLVGQMRSSRLNSIEALLPNHSPFPSIPIHRVRFPLSHDEERRRDATVCELLNESLCRQLAKSLEKQLHESRISQRHQARLFSFRAADPVREPASVYSGVALDLVIGGGEASGLFHSPLISGLEVALASMRVGETAGFFINAPQSFAFSAPDLDLTVPSTPSASATTASTVSGGSSIATSASAVAAFNAVVPGLVRRGADRVLYYEIQLTRRAPAIFAFPPCRGLTLFTVPPMLVQLNRRQLMARGVCPPTGGDSGTPLHAVRDLHEHDVESLKRLRAAAKCNPYSFFLFTNLTRVGRELPVATFCAVNPDVYMQQLEATAASCDGETHTEDGRRCDTEERELKLARARLLVEAETGIQSALLRDQADTTAAANRAFAMAVSMVMGSTTLFDVTTGGHKSADDRNSSRSGTAHGHVRLHTTHADANAAPYLSPTSVDGPAAWGVHSLAPPVVSTVPPSTSLLAPGASSALSDLDLSLSRDSSDDHFETHGLLTHTLEAAMMGFGVSSTAAALRETLVAALSAPNTPTRTAALASPQAADGVSPVSTLVLPAPLSDSHPRVSTGSTCPSSLQPADERGRSPVATVAGRRGASHVDLAAEYERWLTDACHYLDSRFLPCPRGAALVQLRLSRFEPLTEQFYDLLRRADDDGETADSSTPPTGTLISPVCSLAIPCWLSLALTQQLHRAAAADPNTLINEPTTALRSKRDYCVSSVRVHAPIGLPMDQSDEEAFMLHFFSELRTHTTTSLQDCRTHLMEQLDELAGGSFAMTTSSSLDEKNKEDTTQPQSAKSKPTLDKARSTATSARLHTHTATRGSEAVLAAYPCEDRTATTSTATAPRAGPDSSAASFGTTNPTTAAQTIAAATAPAAGSRATLAAAHPSGVPTLEERYHLESRIVSVSPALRKRHFFFLNPKASLGQVRTLLCRVCTLLHIYDFRNPYRRGAGRVGRASLSSSTTSRTPVRQASAHGILGDEVEDGAAGTGSISRRLHASPLAGGGASPSSRLSPHPHGRPPPPHPALAGWVPLETQCAKLTSRLDKIREIPEHEAMVDQLLLGPTVCAQTPADIAAAASREDVSTSMPADVSAKTAGDGEGGGRATPGSPVRTWANVLSCATFFSADECGRLLPEQREKAVLRRCLFKVFELAYLAIVLLTFGTEESQLRPSSFLAQGGYEPYFDKTGTPSFADQHPDLSVRVDHTCDLGTAMASRATTENPRAGVETHCLASNRASMADLLAASMGASTSLANPQAALRTASDNSKRRRYQYLAECYHYVALTFWELLVPYLLTPSALLQKDEPGSPNEPAVLRPMSYTSSTTRKTPIANMLSACGLDAVTSALLYDPHEASLWSLRARFHTQQGAYEAAQRDLDVAKTLTAAEKTEETRQMRLKKATQDATSADTFAATANETAPSGGDAGRGAVNPMTPTKTDVPSHVGPLLQELASLRILEDRLEQLDEQEEHLKALRAAVARERGVPL